MAPLQPSESLSATRCERDSEAVVWKPSLRTRPPTEGWTGGFNSRRMTRQIRPRTMWVPSKAPFPTSTSNFQPPPDVMHETQELSHIRGYRSALDLRRTWRTGKQSATDSEPVIQASLDCRMAALSSEPQEAASAMPRAPPPTRCKRVPRPPPPTAPAPSTARGGKTSDACGVYKEPLSQDGIEAMQAIEESVLATRRRRAARKPARTLIAPYSGDPDPDMRPWTTRVTLRDAPPPAVQRRWFTRSARLRVDSDVAAATMFVSSVTGDKGHIVRHPAATPQWKT